MLTTASADKIAHAQQAIDDLIQLLAWGELKLMVSDTAVKEILAMLRFYRYCVSPEGATPEASAERALEFIEGVKELRRPILPTLDQH